MNFQTVESSNIDALAHEGAVMQVRFKNGSVYEYRNVSEQTYHNLVNADSVGSTFNRVVKKHPELYPFRRLD